MIRKFLCLIGFHRWVREEVGLSKGCRYCNAKVVLTSGRYDVSMERDHS